MNTETAEAFDKLTAAIAQERASNDAYVAVLRDENRKQAARIRELEGALARATRFLEGYRAMHDGLAQEANSGARCACWHCHNSRGIGTSFGSTRPEDSRRILAEGSVKP